MSIRARALLEAVEQELPAALVSDESKRTLGEVARPLPIVVQSVGFECTLAPGADTVDLGMSVTARQAERDSLAGRPRLPDMDRLVAMDAGWARLRAFAGRWGDDAKFSTTRIPFVFLEFDAQRPALPATPPSVFVALDWLIEELTPAARGAAREDPSVVAPGLPEAREIAEALTGRPLPADVSGWLTRAFIELPPAALVLHVGVMLGRPRRGVRLSVGVPRVEVLAYLERVGWRGDSDRLGRTIDWCASACGLSHPYARLQLDFDLQEMPETLGVGLTPVSEQAWRSVLRRISDLVSCDEAKLNALGTWPRHVARRIRDQDIALEHYLSHLKLAWKPAGMLAKGYFGVMSSANPGA
jgi:hypothetical protein